VFWRKGGLLYRPGPVFSIAFLFSFENRGSILPEKPGSGFPIKSIRDFSGTIFDRDRDRDCNFKIGIRFENEIR
jgi:hypothetical protein